MTFLITFGLAPVLLSSASLDISRQKHDDTKPSNSDSQCLMQSYPFRRSVGFASEDDDSGKELLSDRQRHEKSHSTLVEVERVNACEGEGMINGVEPRCKSKSECKPYPNVDIACISGFCVDSRNVNFNWAPATVNSYCPCHDLGKRTMGQPNIKDCKKTCEEMDSCKSGEVTSFCWFFSTCTKATAEAQLKRDSKFDVYFLSASGQMQVPVMTIKRKDEIFRGRRRPPRSKCLSSGNCNDLLNVVLTPPLLCTNGVCHDKETEKFTWTYANVNYMCQVPNSGYLGKLTGRKYKIPECKRRCEEMPACTGFNRGKKASLEAQCWFFAKCTKYTPWWFKRNAKFNLYFVTGTSTIPMHVETFQTQPVVLRG